MTNLLVEGGSEVFGAFLEARLIDELHLFIAPRIVGGRVAPSPVGGAGLESLVDPRRPIVRWSHAMSGNDLYVNAFFMGEQAAPSPQSNQSA
jgi:diaminohydroxyphosphoribosylaminopyrimidine deaminase/5-amino-6-(5-phosphoribosylamino)uracil reductase